MVGHADRRQPRINEMTATELRAAALDETLRRCKVPRSYKVTGVTTTAAIAGNTLDLAALRRQAEAAEDGLLLPWLSSDGHLVRLTAAQARALCGSVDEFEARLYSFLGHAINSINVGTLKTADGIANLLWPT